MVCGKTQATGRSGALAQLPLTCELNAKTPSFKKSLNI